jgi:hypothetical protein
MANIVEIIKNYNVQLALKNIFSKIDEIIRYINSNPSGGGSVTSVTASSPLTSSGGDNPNISISYTPENLANKGVANGYAPLSSDAKVDAAYLPAYVDEVLEYANLAAFPVTGASDKIYIALDTNKVYRWSGSVYIEVAANSGVWGAITGTLSNQTDLQAVLDSKKGYALQIRTVNVFNPADATNYFLGNESTPFTSNSCLAVFPPINGTIKNIVITSRNGAGASSQASTFSLNKFGGGGADVLVQTLTTTYTFSSAQNNQNISTSIAVTTSDALYIKWVTPTWTPTNPTQVRFNIILYIE